jgi:hypothetical protein
VRLGAGALDLNDAIEPGKPVWGTPAILIVLKNCVYILEWMAKRSEPISSLNPRALPEPPRFPDLDLEGRQLRYTAPIADGHTHELFPNVTKAAARAPRPALDLFTL